MLTLRQKIKLCSFAIGIFGCFAIFGLLQEKIYRGRYGDEIGADGERGERYTMPITFLAIKSIFFVLFVKALTFTHEHPKNEASQGFYALSAIFCVIGSVSSHMSLQWVSYLTQVVSKSCRPIPVMIFGVLLGQKRYSYRKVLFVLTIVVGVVLFVYKDRTGAADGDYSLIGNILLATSLLMDGLLAATEDRMRSLARPSPLHFMMYLNFWSSILLMIGIVVFGEGPKVFVFVTKHPEILKYIGLGLITSSIGQVFICSMISNFGPLALSLTTTTRKFFSLCLSVITFGNRLSYRQWGAASLIFGALIVDALLNKSLRKDSAEPESLDVGIPNLNVAEDAQTTEIQPKVNGKKRIVEVEQNNPND